MEEENKYEIEEFTPPLTEAAVQLHELYEELKKAGFTRREALKLVSNVLSTGVAGGIE